MYDLLLRNAHVVDPLNHVNGIADVAVTDGKIAAVGRELTGEAKETVDLTGLVLHRASSIVTFIWAPCGVLPTVRGCSR